VGIEGEVKAKTRQEEMTGRKKAKRTKVLGGE